MSKKNRNKVEGASQAEPKLEDAFMVKMISLAEWQIINLKIHEGQVVERIYQEPNIRKIVERQLLLQLGKAQG